MSIIVDDFDSDFSPASIPDHNNNNKFRKYPRGVFVMFFLQFLGMLGFSVVYALLVLYATQKLGFTDNQAYAITAAFNGLIFALSVFGGFLGEQFTGFRFAVWISIILLIVGLLVMAIPSKFGLITGLSIFILGNAISVPCMYVLLGRLYQPNDPRRASGFTLAYIGMNLGSFIASALSGTMQKYLGFQMSFIIGGLVTIIMLFYFGYYQKLFKETWELDTESIRKAPSFKKRLFGIILVIIGIPITMLLVKYADFNNILLLFVGCLSGGLVLYYAFQEQGNARKKLYVFLAMNIIGVFFWALYSLSPSALMIFIEHNVNKDLFGWLMPTATASAFNPFFIIALGPLLSILWMYLGRRNINVAVATKFGLGTSLMGIGFLVLIIGIHFHNPQGQTNLWWIILSYFFQTAGELFVGPIGYAMVGELVPQRIEGLMMGVWQLAAGVAGASSEFLAILTSSPTHSINPLVTNPNYSTAFAWFGGITLAVGLGTILAAIWLHVQKNNLTTMSSAH